MTSHYPNIDDVVEATLADSRRRYALDVLAESDGNLSVLGLARKTVERTSGQTAADSDDVTAIRIDLYHAFLPKLAAAGVVEFDAEHEQVSVRADCALVQERISALEDTPTRN